MQYTAEQQAWRMAQGNEVTRFFYGPDGARYKRIDQGSGGTTETLYLGNVERVVKNGTPQIRRYLAGVAIMEIDPPLNTRTVKRLLHDHLGSVSLVVSNLNRNVLERYDYDAFGQRRAALGDPRGGWSWGLSSPRETNRGYTGHEMLDAFGLVHMNGRVYDSRTARFLQADPFVQEPNNPQNFNRFTYLWNNPLNATDPSGYEAVTLATVQVIASAAGWTAATKVTVAAFVAAGTYYAVGATSQGGVQAAYTNSAGGPGGSVRRFDTMEVFGYSSDVPLPPDFVAFVGIASVQAYGGKYYYSYNYLNTQGEYVIYGVPKPSPHVIEPATALWGTKDTAQALDMAALVPGPVGTASSLAAAGFHAYNGDYMAAALSTAGAIPFVAIVIKGAKGAKTVSAASNAATGGRFTVGPYNQIRGTAAGMDAHHVGQQALMKQLVPAYDAATAPSILVPKVGHTIRGPNGILSRSTAGLQNVRDVIARDIRELRRVYPDVPNSSLQELIQMNRAMYPGVLAK